MQFRLSALITGSNARVICQNDKLNRTSGAVHTFSNSFISFTFLLIVVFVKIFKEFEIVSQSTFELHPNHTIIENDI